MRGVILQKQDLNADNLNENLVAYTVDVDLRSWDVKFENFPTPKPKGGILVITLNEGAYKKQIYTCYDDYNVYIRYTKYSVDRYVWAPWKRIEPSGLMGLNSIMTLEEPVANTGIKAANKK